ncbi:MAG TPA: hypothetical protein VGR47_21095 [Terracidiphilus sp.]|nr:hypothetical protein [Terracidiphilus sp.]
MSRESTETMTRPRRIGKSVAALVAGFVVNVVLAVGTDLAFHAMGMLPALGQAMDNWQSAMACAYRTFYGVIGSYVVARLAPYAPLEHALVGAGIGMLIATAGAIATWNQALGPHWYPLSLIVLALPTGWLGGKLRVMQLRGRID